MSGTENMYFLISLQKNTAFFQEGIHDKKSTVYEKNSILTKFRYEKLLA